MEQYLIILHGKCWNMSWKSEERWNIKHQVLGFRNIVVWIEKSCSFTLKGTHIMVCWWHVILRYS